MSRPLQTLLALSLALSLAFVPVAAAQGGAHAQLERLLQEAYDDYDFLMVDEAFAKLQEAIDVIDRNGLTGPKAAEVWFLYGILIHAVFEDAEVVIDAFINGLVLDPSAALNPLYRTGTLDELFGAARASLAPPPPPPPPPASAPAPPTPPQPASTPSLQHTPPPGAQHGEALDLTLVAPPALGAQRAAIYYRARGEDNFRVAEMRQAEPGRFVVQLPAAATRVVQLEYYLQVFGAGDAVLQQFAGPGRPQVVPILGAPEPTGRAARAQREAERAPPAEDPLAILGDRSRRSAPGEFRRVHLGIGVGSGVGLATTSPKVYGDQVALDTGLGLSPVHGLLEAGARLGPSGRITLLGSARVQPVFLESGTEVLLVGLVRGRYDLRAEAPLRIFVEGGLGFGRVGHLVYLQLEDRDVFDVTYEGGVHVHTGFGVTHVFSDTIGLQHLVSPSVMFPDFSVHLDYTLALTLSF